MSKEELKELSQAIEEQIFNFSKLVLDVDDGTKSKED
jgi:hypothetical protein